MPFDNIKEIYRRMSHAAMRAGRSPDEVRLIAVTKGFAPETVKAAIESGLREFGENRVQEAKEKILRIRSLFEESSCRWHFIGHLQKNKAKAAVELFDLIHTVDSAELASVLERHAAESGKVQEILVQVKLSDERAKTGITKKKLMSLLSDISDMKHLRIKGLMTMPPYFDDPEMGRPYFKELRRIRDEAEAGGFRLKELSMGMSNDFEVAIEEGATIVRIGTALFGERKRVDK